MRAPYWSFILLLILLPCLSLAQQFQEIGASLPGGYTLAWGDYDGDGDLDLAAVGGNDRVFRNDNGTFNEIPLGQSTGTGRACKWGDYDGDGDLDLLVSRSASSSIYRNDGGTFTDINAGIPGALDWVDYDNDGDLDIVAQRDPQYDTTITLYRNDGGAFVNTNISIAPGISVAVMAWGDYDNDGDLDAVVTGRYGIRLCRNDGGKFTASDSGFAAVSYGSLAWGDYDNDGDLDLLCTGNNNTAKIYRNDGHGGFTDSLWSGPQKAISSAWGDYDGDGDLDVVVAGANSNGTGSTRVYRNDNGIFVDCGSLGIGSIWSGTLAWGDYDNDGRLDIAISGQNLGYPYYATEYIAAVYRNTGASSNIRPGTPSGLFVSESDGAVTFNWTAATDPQTSQKGLSYNLRVGTSPGANDVVSGMSGTSGARFVPAIGNAQQQLSWRVRGVPGGTYYWSVQSIDSGFAGSAWAPEQTEFVPAISGYIRTADGKPLADVLVAVDGTNSTVLTGSDGYYRIGVKAGWTGSIAVSRAMYRFEPPLQQYDSVTSDKTEQNYIASPWLSLASELSGVGDCCLAWGDYDADGKLDLVIAGATGDAPNENPLTRIYHNDGNRVFTPVDADLVGVCRGSVAWADIDSDGDLDLAVCGLTSSSPYRSESRVYRNDGGAFVDVNAGLPGVSPGSVSWGDYDNDGDPDLLLVGSTGDTYIAKVFRNDGGRFTGTDCGIPATADTACAWGDYDNDGDLDMAVARTGYAVSIYRNDRGVFSDTGIYMPWSRTGPIAWGDYDNDGDLDLAVSGTTPSGGSAIWIDRNDGGSFTEVSFVYSGTQSAIAWGDYDNDGDLDLIISGQDPNTRTIDTKLCRNDSGTFVQTAPILPPIYAGSIAFGDYDNDGDVDVAIAGRTAGGFTAGVYTNGGTHTANSAPDAPVELSSSVDVGAVTLSWNRSADDHTPAAGLSYNIRVGRNPGSADVCSGMADAVSGLRRIPTTGNAQKGLSWTLGLPRGTYYWSVQAVDTSFLGSGWASDASVAIDTRKICGYVRDPDSAGIPQVSIVASNGGGSTLTSVDGYYELWVAPGWSGTVTASRAGYVVMPASIALDNVQEDRVDQNFAARKMFVATDVGIAGLSNSCCAWGDYDNDGDLDVAVSGDTGTAIVTRIYRNDNGSFVDIGANLLGTSYGTNAWGDYDNDGDLDLAICGYTGTMNTVKIYRNGDGEFIDTGTQFSNLGGVAWADFDNDGDLDVASGGIIYRCSSGGFEPWQTGLTPGVTRYGVACGDYDNDGDEDVAIVSKGSSSSQAFAKILRNEGGKFVDIQAALSQVSSGSAAWGDYDNDGDLDLALMGEMGNGGVVKIYSNNNGTFTDTNTAFEGQISRGSLAWGDYDSDGDLDLAVCGYSSAVSGGVTRVYRNDGGQFTDVKADVAGVYNGQVAWGDYDNDGKLDLLVTGNEQTTIWRNNLYTSNSIPSSPLPVSATTSGPYVTFQWNAGSDTETPTAGLTYNVRVGSGPRRSDVFSGMSNVTTGFRLVPDSGNVGKRLSWTLKLPAGVYYWSVQSVDTSFAGSSWSEEQSITVDTKKISGYVRDRNGVGVEGMPVLTNDSIDSFVSLKDGYYELWVPTGWTGTVMLGKPGYESDPDARDYEGVTQEQSAQDFTVWHTFNGSAVPGLPQWSYIRTVCGDYDNDGDIDLILSGQATAGSYGYTTKIFRNDGAGFTAIDFGVPILQSPWLAIGDYDNDGYLDLAVSGDYGTGVGKVTRLYHNSGGNFTDSGIALPVSGYVSWGDYDNDGLLDLAVNTALGTSHVTRLYHSGDGTFADSGIAVPSYGLPLFVDYDSDGQIDLAVGGNIYRNDHGTFSLTTSAPSGGSYTSWADYDADGDLDAASGYNVVKIWRNDGGTFTNVSNDPPCTGGATPIWADYDNDGDLDFALENRIYRNDGGSFVPLDGAVGRYVRAWVDLDNDGKLDLFTDTGLYHDDGKRLNSIPAAPSGLSASAAAGLVTFNWPEANDAQTPSNALTYNLRVGTTPGGSNIFSSMADATSGFRRVVTPGPIRGRLSWTLKLPANTYYWSVQAIDGSFAGSPWSHEHCFVVGGANVSGIKTLPLNTAVGCSSAVVAAVFSDTFYIESEDRSGGILVQMPSHGVTPGMKVAVSGNLMVDPDGELYIAAYQITVLGNGSVTPLAMTASSLGGTSIGAQDGVRNWKSADNGVSSVPADGPNNIGLLAKAWGRVTQIDPGRSYFYIEDGSVCSDGTLTGTQENRGVRVTADPGLLAPGQFVVVTGVSSCFRGDDGQLRRLVKAVSLDTIDAGAHH